MSSFRRNEEPSPALDGCFSAFSGSITVRCGTHTATPSVSVPSASTTLQAETGNNTSTANSFTPQNERQCGCRKCEHFPIGSLLYSGATTKVYATWLGWFGQPNHMNVGYISDTAAQVHAQVEDMISRGMAGAIADWYGVANTSIEAATTLLKSEAEAHLGQFEFAIMEDKGAYGRRCHEQRVRRYQPAHL